MRGPRTALLGLLTLALLAPFASRISAAPEEDEEEEVEAPAGPAPGLKLTFVATGKGEERDVRHARLVALAVPEGEPATPFLPVGPFRATWEGSISVAFKGEFTFEAAGRGAIRVTVNDQVAIDGMGDDFARLPPKAVTLKRGENTLVVRYDSPPAGDAVVRVSWSSPEFGREPIPINVLGHDKDDPALVASNRLREGRELVASLRCLKCHQAADLARPGAMPELELDAPSLADVGARLRPEWMARWIDDPRSLRPDATMPRLFHGKGEGGAAPDPRARDIAAFLATLGADPGAEDTPPAPETVALGSRLFAQLGCIGCHARPDAEGATVAADRVSLKFAGEKWKPAALRAFLMQPDRHYAWIKMPNFRLSAEEAANIAAFVASAPREGFTALGLPAPDVEKGRSLVQSSGCLNCHALPMPNKAHAPALKDLAANSWSHGCVSREDAAGKAPDHGLTEPQIQAIRSFAEKGFDSLSREAGPELAERQIKALRCLACHKRDGKEDAWSERKVEVDTLLAKAPPEPPEEAHKYPELQARPPLTWAGEKLKPGWMAAFVAGRVPDKPRPYLRARMPGFARWAEPLACGLALEHGYDPSDPPDSEPDPARAAIGKALVRRTGGLSCTSCHNVGEAAAVGVFEAPGINFMRAKGRLRVDYYDRWIRNPMRVDPETKMPSFFQGGRSVLPTILDGDAEKQAGAIWHYLLQGAAIEHPGD